MSLMSSDIKLGQDVDPTVRRFQAAITRDLEQLYLLMSQGEGGFSNTSPGSVSQDPTTDGLGIEGNQGDYRFSPAVTRDELNAGGIDASVFLQKSNNLSDVSSNPLANYFLGSPFSLGAYTKTNYSTAGSFTHTFSSSSSVYIAFLVGGGGGGGGGSTAALGASGSIGGGGGGGGGGAIVSGRVNVSSLAVVVGAAGTGGALNTAGVDGGDSSITHGSTVINPRGGSHGSAGNGTNGGAGGSGPSTSNQVSADFSFFGFPGQFGGNGGITSITFNGAGAVSSYNAYEGRGGVAAITFDISGGLGGRGGGPGGVGTDGGVGTITIYER